MSKLWVSLAVASVALATATVTPAIHASEATQFVGPPGTFTREQVKEELHRSKADRSVIHYGDTTVFIDPPSTHSRAEVLAELEISRRAGLAALERMEAVDVFSDQYRRASARHAALRRSPEFATLAESIARQRGEALAAGSSHGAAVSDSRAPLLARPAFESPWTLPSQVPGGHAFSMF